MSTPAERMAIARAARLSKLNQPKETEPDPFKDGPVQPNRPKESDPMPVPRTAPVVTEKPIQPKESNPLVSAFMEVSGLDKPKPAALPRPGVIPKELEPAPPPPTAKAPPRPAPEVVQIVAGRRIAPPPRRRIIVSALANPPRRDR